MSVLSAVLHVLVFHRFLACFALLLGSIELSSVARRRGRRRGTVLGPALCIVAAGVNLIWGPALNGAFLHRYGVSATATVTGLADTGNEYNDRRVYRHAVAFRTADGEARTGSFDDDDFNVSPAPGGISYPTPGEVFTLRYIAGVPWNFVIVADDASPYARRVTCAGPRAALAQARSEWELDRSSPRFTASYAARIEAVLRLGCAEGDDARRQLEETAAALRGQAPR